MCAPSSLAWRGLPDDCDAAAQRIANLDRRLERAFADYQRPLSLQETIPGIRRASAHAILVELGPDPEATFGSAHDLRDGRAAATPRRASRSRSAPTRRPGR